ncbi:MAG: DUF1365 domain-containing protein [Planktomarina sp.]
MEHIQAKTRHFRRGEIKNAFTYGVDFVLWNTCDAPTSRLISINRFNIWSVYDRHHGGDRANGIGVKWFKRLLVDKGLAIDDVDIYLLAQPTFLGIHFTPVSFWIATRQGQVCAFVAEVNNTFGQRHCYFCANPGFDPITPKQRLKAEKVMHVSPFQSTNGDYFFQFEFASTHIDIKISYENGSQGVFATLVGPRQNATSRSLFGAAFRRPLGAARVVALIHWQAIKLWFKGAKFRSCPPPPEPKVTDSTQLDHTK